MSRSVRTHPSSAGQFQSGLLTCVVGRTDAGGFSVLDDTVAVDTESGDALWVRFARRTPEARETLAPERDKILKT